MKTSIRNCMVWDGSGAEPFPADVLVEGDTIRRIVRGGRDGRGGRGGDTPPDDDAQVIDARGMTLMPGLVEGHAPQVRHLLHVSL